MISKRAEAGRKEEQKKEKAGYIPRQPEQAVWWVVVGPTKESQAKWKRRERGGLDTEHAGDGAQQVASHVHIRRVGFVCVQHLEQLVCCQLVGLESLVCIVCASEDDGT